MRETMVNGLLPKGICDWLQPHCGPRKGAAIENGWRMKVPFELLIEAGHQQLMFLCISALLLSNAGELVLQFL